MLASRARGFTRWTRRGRQRRGTRGAGALISAPGTRLVALHRPASIRTAYFRSPSFSPPPPPASRFHERPSDEAAALASTLYASTRQLSSSPLFFPSLYPPTTTRFLISFCEPMVCCDAPIIPQILNLFWDPALWQSA